MINLVRLKFSFIQYVVNNDPKISVNYQQYKRSAIKAHNIDLITDLLRESAIDCELFRLRNDTKGVCVGVNNR